MKTGPALPRTNRPIPAPEVNESVRYNVYLPVKMVAQVEALADEIGCSASHIIRTAITNQIEAHEHHTQRV